ncbi:hypothetical protein FOA52_015251 [Chlamydomonas sp. UWO 241]|nr:hypothetical protein FOA52_015251 [Chlamydomonas sp. UWO 241]
MYPSQYAPQYDDARYNGDSAVSGTAHLLAAQERAQARSTKVLLNLTTRAERDAHEQAAHAANQEREYERGAHFEDDREQERRMRLEQAHAQERRAGRARDAARMHANEHVESTRARVGHKDEREREFREEQAARSAQDREHAARAGARRDANYKASQNAAAAQKEEIARRQAMAGELSRQKEELRLLQVAIKAEEASARAMARTKKADAVRTGEALRVRDLESRGHERAAAAATRTAEADEMRRLRSAEARHRAEYISMHANQAAQRDEAERERVRQKLHDKAARADAIQEQRAALTARMSAVRQEMAATEGAARANLERLRASGAALALPPNVVASLQGLGGARVHGGGGGAHGASQFHLVAMRSGSAGRPGVTARGARAPHQHRQQQQQHYQHSHQQQQQHYQHGQQQQHGQLGGGDGGGVGGRRSGLPDVEDDPFDATGMPDQSYDATRAYTTIGPVPMDKASRREQELRFVLRMEGSKELERQRTLALVSEPRERTRLTRIFAAEREAAKEKILALGSGVGVGLGTAA